ncbi:MAG: type II secretion system protein [Phycisphaerales bacterium]|nr:type II secretion system protein [Phycisphaerales bacterium]MDP6891387.1 type II secretion system protein [Phycisphaerales bacterium]
MTHRAFALLEMLVTIAILGILMGLAIPAMNLAAAATMRANCQTNLRQISRAAIQYATQRDGRFPPGVQYGTDGNALSGDIRAWDWWKRPNGRVQPGELWTFTDMNEPSGVLTCPTAIGLNAAWEGDPVTGYNYNVAFIAAEARMPFPDDADLGAWDLVIEKPNLDGLKELRLAQCRRSGTTALFGTGGRAGGTNKFMRSPVNVGGGYDTAYAGGQSFPGGSSNVGFVDGHVSRHVHPFQGQHWDDLPDWLTNSLEWPKNGFLSDDATAYDPR